MLTSFFVDNQRRKKCLKNNYEQFFAIVVITFKKQRFEK
jgi:hypothetical protein